MWWAIQAAWAEPVCEPLDAPTFRAAVFDAQSAIDRGDVDLSTGIVDGTLARLPCLDFGVDASLWAELLVSWAIIEYSRDGDWQGPLTAALRLRRGIDRAVGPGHPIYNYDPPDDRGEGGPPVPPTARIRVDGRPSPVLPPDTGVYLVQKTDGRFWNTVLVRDGSLPYDWVTERVVAPPRVVVRGRFGPVVGLGASRSSPDWETTRFPLEGSAGVAMGGAGDLVATFYSPFGVAAHARGAWFPGSLGIDGRVLGVFDQTPVTVGLGAALSTLDVRQKVQTAEPGVLDEITSAPAVRYAVATFALRPHHTPLADGGRAVDLSLTAGVGPGYSGLLDVDVGLATAVGGQPVRVAVLAAVRQGEYAFTGLPGGVIEASSLRVLLRLDLLFGEG